MKSLFLTSLLFGALTTNLMAGEHTTKAALTTLKAKLSRYGAVKIEGTEDVGGKKVPGLLFGSKKINNVFDIVDDVKKDHEGTATVFVKDGEEYIRISTNVLKDDGARAVGTPLAHNKAYEAIQKGETFCGEVEILGSKYDTCYEPIKDAASKTVGIYYVGYKK